MSIPSDGRHDVVIPGVASQLSGASRTTLRRWAVAGLVWSVTTPGGHHRYDRAEMTAIRELLSGLTSIQVAALFHVAAKTPTQWAARGVLAAKRTPGGNLRFRPEDVEALLAGGDLR
jgi:predicted site-specific integrase-resolvase